MISEQDDTSSLSTKKTLCFIFWHEYLKALHKISTTKLFIDFILPHTHTHTHTRSSKRKDPSRKPKAMLSDLFIQ